MSKTLIIKNMVCNRCIIAVEHQFESHGIKPEKVILGEVEIREELSPSEYKEIKNSLENLGFEILDDKNVQQIAKIKALIINLIHYQEEKNRHQNYSQIIAQEIGKDYSSLSNLFSEIEGTTIEKYIINQKIEKVKELLAYDELSLSEISYKMGYSSVAHLSSQFKKVTGLTPSHFKRIGENRRKPLDEV
jgi:AraC family transcriptional regulator